MGLEVKSVIMHLLIMSKNPKNNLNTHVYKLEVHVIF